MYSIILNNNAKNILDQIIIEKSTAVLNITRCFTVFERGLSATSNEQTREER